MDYEDTALLAEQVIKAAKEEEGVQRDDIWKLGSSVLYASEDSYRK